MDQIRIENLEVFCHHGVYKEENVLGQKFLVSAVLFLRTRKAGKTDELTDSVSYGDVCRLITSEMKKQNDKLLERVAERLAEKILLSFPMVERVSVEVKKPWAPVLMHLDYASVRIERSWHRAYIGVGSNLGDRESYLELAERRLSECEWIRNLKAAAVIETEPYGYLDQGNFLNTVFWVDTLLEPEELLEELHRIEQEANRTREIHWGPRTLDLDILLYDHLVTEEEALIIPHSELHKRLFVLDPLCELNPYGVHPLLKKRFCDLRDELHQTKDDNPDKSSCPENDN